MSVRKKCGASNWPCAYRDHRCDHSWVSELMIDRVRRPPVQIDEYATARGATVAHIVSKRDAQLWEARIIMDWRQGLDPTHPPGSPTAAEPVAASSIAGTLDDYAAVEVPKLRVQKTTVSEIRHLRAYFGARPLVELEREGTGLAFHSALRDGWRPPDPTTGEPQAPLEDGRGPAAVNRLMQRLRHFINWCRFQQPPRLTRTPFHRYGIQIKAGDEVQRTRRLREGEEAALLAACDLLDSACHKYSGRALKRRLLGTLWLGARGSELDRVHLADVNFKTWDVTLRRGKSQPRTVWLAEASPLRALLEQRRFLAPEDFIFGDDEGRLYNPRSAWETVLLLAHGKIPPDGVGRTSEQAAIDIAAIDLHVHDLRRECASRWWEQRIDLLKISRWLGHADFQMTQRYLQLTDQHFGGRDMEETLTGKRRL
jgi:integrase